MQDEPSSGLVSPAGTNTLMEEKGDLRALDYLVSWPGVGLQ